MQPRVKQKAQADLYKEVFSLPVSGKSVKGELNLAQKSHNRARYGKELVTYLERESWVKETVPEEMENEFLAAAKREHCLQLRNLHPDKKRIISSFLRTLPSSVFETLPGTELS